VSLFLFIFRMGNWYDVVFFHRNSYSYIKTHRAGLPGTVHGIEYGLKLATAPRRVAFVKAPANVVDLLAVAPFWLELIVQVCVEGIRTGKQSQVKTAKAASLVSLF